MIEKRMNVFDNDVKGRSLRLYTCEDVCQEATHVPNRETSHHTIWPPAILLGLLHQSVPSTDKFYELNKKKKSLSYHR